MIQIYKRTTEVFDNYLSCPPDIDSLANEDISLIRNMLHLAKYDSVYAFVISVYDSLKSDTKGLWEELAALNEYPDEEYKLVINFKEPICESEYSTSSRMIRYGVAKISTKFYLENYSFFNSRSGADIFLANEANIETIIQRLHVSVKEMSSYEIMLGEKDWQKIAEECELLYFGVVDDDEEFKEITICKRISSSDNLIEKYLLDRNFSKQVNQ